MIVGVGVGGFGGSQFKTPTCNLVWNDPQAFPVGDLLVTVIDFDSLCPNSNVNPSGGFSGLGSSHIG